MLKMSSAKPTADIVQQSENISFVCIHTAACCNSLGAARCDPAVLYPRAGMMRGGLRKQAVGLRSVWVWPRNSLFGIGCYIGEMQLSAASLQLAQYPLCAIFRLKPVLFGNIESRKGDDQKGCIRKRRLKKQQASSGVEAFADQ